MTEHHKQGLESRNRGPDPAPCSRKPPIPNFCHRYPEHHFLSQYRIRAEILANLAFPVAVKSRIPLSFPDSPTVFWSIPETRKTLPDPAQGFHLRLLILTLSFRFLLRYMVRYIQSPLRSHRRAVSSYSTLQQFSIRHFDFTSLGTY